MYLLMVVLSQIDILKNILKLALIDIYGQKLQSNPSSIT